mmetsp:Transcript_45489/g.75557  ORF Transcript_45489/g.75557 Transcript_45489/m.75557 type:complete len:224 (+) Transcript_45489:93-764(+)
MFLLQYTLRCRLNLKRSNRSQRIRMFAIDICIQGTQIFSLDRRCFWRSKARNRSQTIIQIAGAAYDRCCRNGHSIFFAQRIHIKCIQRCRCVRQFVLIPLTLMMIIRCFRRNRCRHCRCDSKRGITCVIRRILFIRFWFCCVVIACCFLSHIFNELFESIIQCWRTWCSRNDHTRFSDNSIRGCDLRRSCARNACCVRARGVFRFLCIVCVRCMRLRELCLRR